MAVGTKMNKTQSPRRRQITFQPGEEKAKRSKQVRAMQGDERSRVRATFLICSPRRAPVVFYSICPTKGAEGLAMGLGGSDRCGGRTRRGDVTRPLWAKANVSRGAQPSAGAQTPEFPSTSRVRAFTRRGRRLGRAAARRRRGFAGRASRDAPSGESAPSPRAAAPTARLWKPRPLPWNQRANPALWRSLLLFFYLMHFHISPQRYL